MFDFPTLIQQGAANAWLFVPSAILLGVLHGLEPGHSKTMMAAFIIAVRGTVMQAVLLGLAATISHTLVVWAVALIGLHFSQQIDAEGIEAYFQMASGIVIIALAIWMYWRTWRETHHEHDHDHHHDEAREIATTRGKVILSINEVSAPPVWQIKCDAPIEPQDVKLTLARPDGRSETYAFHRVGDALVSNEKILEPHAFSVQFQIRDGGRTRYEATRQSKNNNLPCGHLPIGKAFLDVHRMLALMLVSEVLTKIDAIVRVVMLFKAECVATPRCSIPNLKLDGEGMRLENFLI